MKKFTALVLCLTLLACAFAAQADEIDLGIGGIVKIDAAGTVMDLDSDGDAETISLTETIAEDSETYALTVNDAVIEGSGWALDGELWAMRLDDAAVAYLLVSEDGPSDDPAVYVYKYSEKGLEYAGAIGVEASSIVITGSGFTAPIRGNVLQTWWHDAEFIVADGSWYDYDNDTVVEYQPYVAMMPRGLYEMGTVCKLLVDLPLQASRENDTIEVTLPAGTMAVIVGTDDADWLYINGIEDYDNNIMGGCGWVRLNDHGFGVIINGEEAEGSEVFQGLLFAD